MAYDLQIGQGSGFLKARVIGERTREAVIGVAKETVLECVKRGAALVLVDVREMRGRLTTLESFEIPTDEFARLPRQRPLRRAAVVDLAENRERFEFFETVARNRGFNLRFFDDEELAEEWLKQTGPPGAVGNEDGAR